MKVVNIKKGIVAAATVAGLFSVAQPANAVATGGLIYFTGELVSTSCQAAVAGDDIGVPSGTIDAGGSLYENYSQVTLPTIPITELNANGKTAGQTTFHIIVWGCNGVAPDGSSDSALAGSSVKAYFSGGPFVNSQTGRLKNAREAQVGTDDHGPGAQHVELELLDGSQHFQKINIGNGDQISGGYVTSLNSGYAVLPYAVRYYSTGSANAGIVESLATYTLVYH
ncbi:fimbrial protein [Edwardsiella tarda]|uniref:fimbrial protein n=1 Tax=Edwardsiella tarda TaxID=636 RepID=UPI00351C70D3